MFLLDTPYLSLEQRIEYSTGKQAHSEGMELAFDYYVMKKSNKKILIVDEAGFSRICAAILEKEGFGTNAVSDVRQLGTKINYEDIGLVITSYPYGAVLFDKLIDTRIPTIILSDFMNRDLMATLDHFDKTISHCMIKPLDYHKFRNLVNQVMRRDIKGAGQLA